MEFTADWADRCGFPPQRLDSFGFFVVFHLDVELTEGIGNAIKVIMSRSLSPEIPDDQKKRPTSRPSAFDFSCATSLNWRRS